MTAADVPTSVNVAGLRGIEAEFHRLTSGTDPLGFNCAPWTDHGLPARFMNLADLRRWIIDHPRARSARNTIWRELIHRARDDQNWMVAALGMAVYGLKDIAGTVCRGMRGDVADIEQEIVWGFMVAVHGDVDPDAENVFEQLRWPARRAGWAARDGAQPFIPVADVERLCGAAPRWPWDHPDLIVARAVDAGVIDHEDAVLFVATRLDRVPIEFLADRFGVDVSVLRMRRTRAKKALADALRDGTLSIVVGEPTRAELRRRTGIRAGVRASLAAG